MRRWLSNLFYLPRTESWPPPARCMEVHWIRDKRVTGMLTCKYPEGHVCDHTTKDGITWR